MVSRIPPYSDAVAIAAACAPNETVSNAAPVSRPVVETPTTDTAITAMTAIEYCLEQGLRVPEDIRFVGYDDIEAAARFKPPLTTVKMDKEALGYVAAKALIEGDVAPNDASLPVELVVRDSSRAVAAQAEAAVLPAAPRRRRAA